MKLFKTLFAVSTALTLFAGVAACDKKEEKKDDKKEEKEKDGDKEEKKE